MSTEPNKSAHRRKQPIVIVDDHPVLRDGLARLIDGEFDLCVSGQAESVTDALALIRQTRPALVVVDLSLKDGSGLDLISQVATSCEGVRSLVLSMHDEAIFAPRALRAGASGYVSKSEPPEAVLDAIRTVLRGELYVSATTNQRLLRDMVAGPSQRPRSIVESLTDRELEVFELVGRGIGTRDIAQKLHLSIKTIESHREHIKEKLGLNSGRELTRHAVLWVNEQC
ncbi:MAG: response regulator transcription factor [Phycisphaerae bacterium]|nr:response regulator transcription factor [Phycisphaerae bacterium]NUQ45943.1 response regulator transcription factor [Phycisphaerae bacterium]